MDNGVKVYIKTDTDNNIIEIGSSVFITDTTGWYSIDEGLGDKYAHAQNYYLDKPLIDNNGCYNYTFNNNKISEKTEYDKSNEVSYLNRLKSDKISEIQNIKDITISEGFDCNALDRGNLHYTMTKENQSDIESLKASIDAGATQVLWHDSSRVMHEVYTATQFMTVYKAAWNFTISCKIRCDGLCQYVLDIINSEEEDRANKILNINWNTELPTYIKTAVEEQINALSLK